MDSNGMNLEVIDFYRPDNSKKCLFISNLHKFKFCNDIESETNSTNQFLQIQEQLINHFSKFGILYDVNVIDSIGSAATDSESVFGFVRFYSTKDASTAKKQLTGRLFINGALPRIKYSVRESSQEPPVLYLAKCYELANHFLGFNGWTTKILVMSDESSGDSDSSVCYRCVVQLKLVTQDLHSEGVGVSKQTCTINDPKSKGVATCKAKKNSFQEATRNAFSKVVLVRLPDDRVYAEVNTTVEDVQHFDEGLDTSTMLKVTELTEDPVELSDDEDNPSQVDDLNKLILQEMADDTM